MAAHTVDVALCYAHHRALHPGGLSSVLNVFSSSFGFSPSFADASNAASLLVSCLFLLVGVDLNTSRANHRLRLSISIIPSPFVDLFTALVWYQHPVHAMHGRGVRCPDISGLNRGLLFVEARSFSSLALTSLKN